MNNDLNNIIFTIDNKPTKEVIFDYLKKNKGREIAVNEISERFKFKLSRISNAIKELELAGKIIIDRKPLVKGKYTVIRLRGDTITQFATHDREIKKPIVSSDNTNKINYFDNIQIIEASKFLKSVNYTQTRLQEVISTFDNYFSLVIGFIQPLMYEVGQQWQNGSLTVAEEHLITARLEKLISNLIKNEPNQGSKTIILAPVENETHTLNLLILELLLVEKRLHAINLSRTLSFLSLIEFIKKLKVKPDWIFYTITIESYIANLKLHLKLIKDELSSYNIKIAIGGQGISKFTYQDLPAVDKLVKNSTELQEFLLLL